MVGILHPSLDHSWRTQLRMYPDSSAAAAWPNPNPGTHCPLDHLLLLSFLIIPPSINIVFRLALIAHCFPSSCNIRTSREQLGSLVIPIVYLLSIWGSPSGKLSELFWNATCQWYRNFRSTYCHNSSRLYPHSPEALRLELDSTFLTPSLPGIPSLPVPLVSW